MSNTYRFSAVKSSEDEPVAWSDQVTTQTTLNLSNATMSSPSDSINDTFTSAIEGDNETQYLSVLETTNDVTLEDLPNLSSENNTDVLPEHLHSTDNGEQQVVIFKLDGSDDLYGIQFAQDEEGNIQKYQFQFRTREDGELEAIPDTIQLLPNETDEDQSTGEVMEAQESHSVDFQNDQTLVSQAHNSERRSDSNSDDSQIPLHKEQVHSENHIEDKNTDESESLNENTLLVLIKSESRMQSVEDPSSDLRESDDNYSEEEVIDVKPGFLEIQESLPATKLKQEYIKGNCELSQNEDVHHDATEEIPYEETEVHEETVIAESIGECHSEADTFDAETQDEETFVEYQHFDPQNGDDVYEENQTIHNPSDQSQILQDEQHYANIYIEDGRISELTCNTELQQHILPQDVHYIEEGIAENDSEYEDYEIVEGLPVTADISEASSSPLYEQESLYSEPIIQPLPLSKHITSMATNVLKQPMQLNNVIDAKKKTVLYYMVTTDQKENVNSFPLGEAIVPTKPNPRSLLKNNVEARLTEDKKSQEKVKEREKVLEKRYARSKEAVQAKLFNNFINKTTIPHAPVRLTRLPRKQEIRPVDTRRNEEIIVQEVMVSSKGFVENVNDRLKNKDKFEVTSIVELSDSDEEYKPKNSTKKKKKLKKVKQTSIAAASEDSDTSVIEILHSDEESEKLQNDKEKSPGRTRKSLGDALKRPRGRPPKHDGSSPQKKSRTESSELESDAGKLEITCPHCPKTFASQNSLTTHIQHHNLENSLRSNSKFQAVDYKHQCEVCQEKFKNSILLKKHVCQKKDAKLKCNTCSKYFKDMAMLNTHKKTHVKQNLVKTTTSVTISPKKFIPRPSTSKFKSPKKVSSTVYKCKRCAKICPTQASLTIHEKSHKSFECSTCKASFASKILLDTHTRLTCVKTKSPKNRRLSLTVRKSFVHSPRKSSVRKSTVKRKLVNPGLNSPSMARTLDVAVICDACPVKFNTLTALFKHKVKEHGLHTPDKKVLEPEKKTIHKPLKTHGGVPTPAYMNKAFQSLKDVFGTSKGNDTLIEDPKEK